MALCGYSPSKTVRSVDYRILDNSPARDAGTTYSYIAEDFIGTLRATANPMDIGAYEISSR